MPVRLHLDPWREIDGQIELAATLELSADSRRLWWRVPAEWADSLTTHADPFVIGLIFEMMSAGEEVEVLAPVSSSLLANLERFMDAWHGWLPSLYRRVAIRSADEVEAPEPTQPAQFVMPFSCGVDSCFTALRHRRHLAGRSTRDVVLGVTMFGFDIREGEANAAAKYQLIADGAGEMLRSLGMAHVEVSTNFRSLRMPWAHSHGAQLASGLSLFGKRFGGALIPDSVPIKALNTIWGSHPFSDPLLGSKRFEIISDGVGIARWLKIGALEDWPEAMRGLRVCFGADGSVGNCGKCEKCIRTALAFKIAGVEPPAGLPRDVDAQVFRSVRLKQDISIAFWNDLLEGIEQRGKSDEPWARGVRSALRRSRRMRIGKSIKQPFVPLRNKIREIFRGSAMSRKDRQAATKRP